MRLFERLQMHARVQGGALYSYHILDEAKNIVGSKSIRISKKTKPWTDVSTYFLGEQEFRTVDEFKAALAAQIEAERRDAEWESAKPKDPPT